MERLTFEGDFCDIAMCLETRGGSFCEDGACSQRRVWERLKHYEDLEEQGWLVVLPCKVGETVYAVKFATHEEDEAGELAPIAGGGEWVIWPVRVSVISYCDYLTKDFASYVICSTANGSGVTFSFAGFGKTVFLTREEAEAALAADKKEANQ